MKKGLAFAVVLGVMLSGCYLFVPNDTTGIASITVDPAYLTVGPGEQVTVNVTTDLQARVSAANCPHAFAFPERNCAYLDGSLKL